MFKYAKIREVLWPVTLSIPRDDGSGEVDNVSIKVRFKLLDRSEMAELMTRAGEYSESITAAQIADDMALSDRDLCSRITGWEGVVDADSGEPIPYSPENAAALININYVRAAIDAGLWEASRGAPAKNSLPGLGG